MTMKTFKKGDRVRVVVNNGPNGMWGKVGDSGTVLTHDKNILLVDIDGYTRLYFRVDGSQLVLDSLDYDPTQQGDLEDDL